MSDSMTTRQSTDRVALRDDMVTIGRAVPVVVTCAGIPFMADHRSATPATASLSLHPSSGSGRSASTDRRASERLSRASRVAAST